MKQCPDYNDFNQSRSPSRFTSDVNENRTVLGEKKPQLKSMLFMKIQKTEMPKKLDILFALFLSFLFQRKTRDPNSPHQRNDQNDTTNYGQNRKFLR